MASPSYHGRTHEKTGTDPFVINPNLICDDIPSGFDFDWNNYTGQNTTTFSTGAVTLSQVAFGTGPYYQPDTAKVPPVVSYEWVELRLLLSTSAITGFTGAGIHLADIVGAAENSANQSSSLAGLVAFGGAGTLTLWSGTALATSPYVGSYADNLATASINLVANQIYDIQMFARVTDTYIYSRLIVDEVVKLNQKIANPVAGSGGLTETAAFGPRFGINSAGSGAPPSWTFRGLRYAIKSADRRPCSAISWPYA